MEIVKIFSFKKPTLPKWASVGFLNVKTSTFSRTSSKSVNLDYTSSINHDGNF